MANTEWEQFMPDACPWCGSQNEPGRWGAGRCNNSWHRSHPDHLRTWPMWRKRSGA